MTDPPFRVGVPVGFLAAGDGSRSWRGARRAELELPEVAAVARVAPGDVAKRARHGAGIIDEEHPLNGAGDTGDPRGTG